MKVEHSLLKDMSQSLHSKVNVNTGNECLHHFPNQMFTNFFLASSTSSQHRRSKFPQNSVDAHHNLEYFGSQLGVFHIQE